tara:strand:- start:7463 stop:7669 length:207 start_codon:yes stop_codon:yes gene_type:complete
MILRKVHVHLVAVEIRVVLKVFGKESVSCMGNRGTVGYIGMTRSALFQENPTRNPEPRDDEESSQDPY